MHGVATTLSLSKDKCHVSAPSLPGETDLPKSWPRVMDILWVAALWGAGNIV